MSSFLFDLINKAKQLDIEGNYVEADRVYLSMQKIAQAPTDPVDSSFSGTAQDSMQQATEWFAGSELDRRHKANNILNAIINSLFRIESKRSYSVGNIFTGASYEVFELSEENLKKFKDIRNELIRIRQTYRDKSIPPRKEYDYKIIDIAAEETLNNRIDQIATYCDAINSLINHIDGLTAKDLGSANLNAELKMIKIKLAEIKDPTKKFSPELINQTRQNIHNTRNTGFTDKPTVGQPFKEPSSWKEKRMPDAAPDIFGATVSGSKAAINSGVDKLNNTDDSQFLNIYQGEIETIENAFIANEGKLTGQEKAKYQREMKSLEDRYYTLLYKDKEKPFVD
jgi:hypothetical protein